MTTWSCELMIGDSEPMKRLREFIGKVASTDTTVLIQGESGTGKELVARAIHQQSGRSGEFVPVNCAALTESLAESILFGHERGAFTGAIHQQKGKFELADGGTLFLDEVGELSASLQAKMLRAVQERAIERVGGNRTIRLDVRFVAATNRDLRTELRAGRFRNDLYHRLNVAGVMLPPLRDRREDIQALTAHFMANYSDRHQRPVKEVSPEAAAILRNYDWPGNVRELEHVLERAVTLGAGETVGVEDLPESLNGARPQHKGYREILYDTQCRIVTNAFVQSNGRYTVAAALLKLRAKDMHRLLRRLNLTHLLRQLY